MMTKQTRQIIVLRGWTAIVRAGVRVPKHEVREESVKNLGQVAVCEAISLANA